jgi:hypothetical protein
MREFCFVIANFVLSSSVWIYCHASHEITVISSRTLQLHWVGFTLHNTLKLGHSQDNEPSASSLEGPFF